MQALGPRAFGEILDDATGKTACDPERVDGFAPVETHRNRRTKRCAHGAENTGRMEPGFVYGLGYDHRHPAQRLDARHESGERSAAVATVALACGEHGGADDRAAVHGPPFEGVIEVLA